MNSNVDKTVNEFETEEWNIISEYIKINELHSYINTSNNSRTAAMAHFANDQLEKTIPTTNDNQTDSKKVRLYGRRGFSFMILSDGKVVSDELGDNPAGVLEMTTINFNGEVRFRGIEVNLYLAMNSKGELYGEKNPQNYATIFIEELENPYTTYLSHKYAHLGWYLGIKKNGRVKKGPFTKSGQIAIQFLKVPISE